MPEELFRLADVDYERSTEPAEEAEMSSEKIDSRGLWGWPATPQKEGFYLTQSSERFQAVIAKLSLPFL